MNLREQINNSDYWPEFENPEHLGDLNEIADEAFGKNSIEGYLAALLIYHQLCEKMAKLLIEDSEFFIKASIYPTDIQFKKHNKAMFGKTIEQLKEAIEFQEKNLFIKKCENFNQIRNSLTHGLTKQTSISDVKESLEKIQILHDEIFELFDSAHDWFRSCFHDFKKDVFIDYDE